jgi:hypothetical protein
MARSIPLEWRPIRDQIHVIRILAYNIRLGWKWLTITITLAYNGRRLIVSVKKFCANAEIKKKIKPFVIIILIEHGQT